MKEIKDVLVNDPSSELIDYLKEKSRKQGERRNMFMPLMTNLFSHQQTAAANASVYYPPQNGINSRPTGLLMHTLNKINWDNS